MNEIELDVPITGFLLWFDDEKGYGFIRSGVNQYFLHRNELNEHKNTVLRINDRIVFIPRQGPKGWIAKDAMLYKRRFKGDLTSDNK